MLIFKKITNIPLVLSLSRMASVAKEEQFLQKMVSDPPADFLSRIKIMENVVTFSNKTQIPLKYREQAKKFIYETVDLGLSSQKMNKKQLVSLIGTFSYNSIHNVLLIDEEGKIKELISDERIAKQLISKFQFLSLQEKGYAIKFILNFHPENQSINQKLQQKLLQFEAKPNQNIKECLYFLRQLSKYLPQMPQNSIQKLLKHEQICSIFQQISVNIMKLSPKQLSILSAIHKIVQKYPQGKTLTSSSIIIKGVEQHCKYLQMIQCKNVKQLTYVLQTLCSCATEHNIPKIQAIVLELYNYIGKIGTRAQGERGERGGQGEEFSEDDLRGDKQDDIQDRLINENLRIRLIDINIIMESMLKLSVIDPDLFSLLQNQFFRLLNISSVKSVGSYLMLRNRITKAVISNLRNNKSDLKSQQKIRIIKQEHVRFVVELFENLKTCPGFSLVEILNMIQICQEIPVKSKKMKRILKAFSEQTKDIKKDQLAYLNIVIDGF